MGLFDKVLDVMRLNDEDDYYDDYEDEYEEEEEEPVRKRFFFKKTGTDDIEQEDVSVTSGGARSRAVSRSSGGSSGSNITPMRGHRSSKAMEVCVIKPTSFEDSREISETLLANRMVILNMEGMDTGTAQRIIDFTSGSCFAIAGNLQKISHYIFIITPASVDISGDFQDILGGAFDMPLNTNI